MNNYLENGTVLPYGILGLDTSSYVSAFNKTYKNTQLRLGIIVNSYPVSSSNNYTKLTTEYDVLVLEQNENISSTSILYKNCISSDSFGSIADFFEKSLRFQKIKKDGFVDLKGQDGSIVLILCLDGLSERAIIVGSLTHPDRKTNLTTDQPYLEGEYNGVNIKINTDGSCALTFKGATDNEGGQIDASQGNSTINIEKNGSIQLNHSGGTIRMDRQGTITITANGDVNVNATKGNVNVVSSASTTVNAGDSCTVNSGSDTSITAGSNCNITSSSDTSITTGGNCSITSSSDTSITASGNCNITSTAKTSIQALEIDLNGGSSGITTMNSHLGVIDLITGVPVIPSPTVKSVP
jgi:phage gp45-like